MVSAPALIAAGLASALLAAIAGYTYQRRGAAEDSRRHPPPGLMVDVGGRRLHVQRGGHGRPLVVFEAGISASSLSWAHVQPRVAAVTETLSYDRAGLAWSDPTRGRITAARCANDLRAMLDAARVTEPCVFVGHSYAGFVLHLFAVTHPSRVAGLVLVDPIFPAEWLGMRRRERWRLKGGVAFSRLGAGLARLGVVRGCLSLLARGSTNVPRGVSRAFGPDASRMLSRLVGEVRKLPEDTWPAIQSHWSQPKCFSSMAEHLAGLRRSAAEVAQSGHLPPEIPLTVITGATQPRLYHDEHARMAGRSSRGRHLVAAGSGHWILLDEPELVVQAIRDVIERGADRQAG